jgi:hypothetical protein
MNEPQSTPARSLRITPEEVIDRLRDGQSVRFLDVRSQKALTTTSLQILGSIRFNSLTLPVDPNWDSNQVLVVYCT